MTVKRTREQWLCEAMEMMRESFFSQRKCRLPRKVRVSCGLTPGKSIGVCFHKTASTSGHHEIFINPTQSNAVNVLEILLHELVHAQLGVGEGHGKLFKARVAELGLAGKATATYAEEGSPLHKRLRAMARQLGRYPHTPMDLAKKRRSKIRESNWQRFESINESTYRVVANLVKVKRHGAPLDPWGDDMIPTKER